MIDQSAFTGSWEKTATTQCSEIYPTRITFEAKGLFRGTGARAGTRLGWDVGTYQIVGPTKVHISLPNDQVEVYTYHLVGDTLTFVDPDGCTFEYRRLPA